jgi:hypothetical protein
MMKKILFLILIAPALCFGQDKPEGIKKTPDYWIGAGFAFYPGSSADVHFGQAGNNPFKAGFTAEVAVEKQLNSFLYAGLGSSLFSFKDLQSPCIPVFADIRVIGTGVYKLYSFLDPGYGIYHNSYYYPLTDHPVTVTEHGGFFIAYGFGVIYKKLYLQAKYNWLRFSSEGEITGKSSKAYGVGGISFGVRFR